MIGEVLGNRRCVTTSWAATLLEALQRGLADCIDKLKWCTEIPVSPEFEFSQAL